MRLTVRSTAGLKLPAQSKDYIEWDDDVGGFGIRLREGGGRSWVFQYKIGTKQRRVTIGSVSAVDLNKARQIAKDLYARVRLGEDPAADKANARIAASETLGQSFSGFLPINAAVCGRVPIPTSKDICSTTAERFTGCSLPKSRGATLQPSSARSTAM
jgi:hypothetical protein